MLTAPASIRVRAPAKINLFLDVLGKRADGYHDIRSLLLPLTLCDELTLESTDAAIETVVDSTHLPFRDRVCLGVAGDNLATRAATMLKERTGYGGGARISIDKRIPVAGGLGGGSADAAVVLLGLNELWQTGLSRDELGRLGARIGCDIPALVHGGTVCMEGLGEIIKPVLNGGDHVAPHWWLVLANPGFGVSTKDIYMRHKSILTSNPSQFKKVVFALKEGSVGVAGENLYNALQATVFEKYPLLRMLADGLRDAGATGVLLSGSGATVFALGQSRDHADRIEARIRQTMGPWLWTQVVMTLPDGVMVAHGPLEARV